jgi:hypothetical protein
MNLRIYIVVFGVIILSIFVLITSKETFNNNFDYKKINRIKVGENYGYCIGGEPACPINNAYSLISISDTGYDGNTYAQFCKKKNIDDKVISVNGYRILDGKLQYNVVLVGSSDSVWMNSNDIPGYIATTYPSENKDIKDENNVTRTNYNITWKGKTISEWVPENNIDFTKIPGRAGSLSDPNLEIKTMPVECSGNMFSDLDPSKLPNESLDYYRLPKSDVLFPISSINKGFTSPTNYIPATISGNKINFVNSNGIVNEFMDVCDVYFGTNQENCRKSVYGSTTGSLEDSNKSSFLSQLSKYFFHNVLSSGVEDTTEEGDTNDDSENTDGSSSGGSSSSNYSSTERGCDIDIHCIADFGTKIGDNLCCGQEGSLEEKDIYGRSLLGYVCPATKPKCKKFNCDTKKGICQ